MRIFKKDGNLKPKKSNDEDYIESLLAKGWVEVNVANPKVKEKIGEKKDVGKGKDKK